MVGVNEAIKHIESRIQFLDSIKVSLIDSLNYVLSEDVFAKVDVPSFDNSAMDGYALNFIEDVSNYELTHSIQAGDTEKYQIKDNQAFRIYTGAPIPQNANVVLQQEIVEVNENQLKFDQSKVKFGMNIRTIGSQCRKDQKIVSKGVLITPAIIGLLSSAGVFEVEVYKKPKISILITGNELQMPNLELEFGQIYNSNEFSLVALLKSLNINEITAYQVKDIQSEVIDKIKIGLEKSDVLIITGGVSVGDYDFVRDSLDQNMVESLFYKVKQKPGKPLFVGKKAEKWIFALPGNPAAVITCFNQYVKPLLKSISGLTNQFDNVIKLPLTNDFTKSKGLTFFLKGKYNMHQVEILQGQESFNLMSFNAANCIIKIEEDLAFLPAGSLVEVYPFTDL